MDHPLSIDFGYSSSYSSISNDSIGSEINPSIKITLSRSKLLMCWVLQFPTLRWMTLGGCPRRSAMWKKSESFVIMTKPCSAANLQMISSSFFVKSKSETCCESGNATEISRNRRREIFWSNSNFTQQPPLVFSRGQQRKSNRREYHPW